MSRMACALALFCAAVLAAHGDSAQAAALTTTQTDSLPLTTTDFQSGSSNVNPLQIAKFNDQNGTLQLDAVDLTLHASIQNDFGMKFVTPATITTSVATNDPNTPGPVITLYQPNGTTPLLTAKAPNDPSFLTRSKTYGTLPGQTLPQTFGPNYPTTSPFYLASAVTQASNSLKLTQPSDLALFTGTGKVALPVSAKAFSSISTSSGNGSGSVSTYGTANVTVTYEYHLKVPAPQTVPEPATLTLWGLGGFALALLHRRRRAA